MHFEEPMTEDKITFAQALEKVFNQMSLKAGIKMFGNKAIKGMTKELQQMHLCDSFIPWKREDITAKQWQNRCKAVNPMKEKSDGTIKGRCCADGRVQRDFMSKEESASPTTATKLALLMGVIEVQE